MALPTVDVLLITCNRPAYTRLAIERLLESCSDGMRLWLWHNGTHSETLELVRDASAHPRVERFHHCPENTWVRAATNWLFEHATGDLLSVVADDSLVSPRWAETLRQAHQDEASFGVLAGWHFHPDDWLPDVARAKIRTMRGGHQVMLNPWVQGSGVMIKRACVERLGPIPGREDGFSPYCRRIACAGWVNGWYVPLLPIDHMDDPRSEHTQLHTDADLVAHRPLSARFRGVQTIDGWVAHLRRSARVVQEAPADPRLYVGLRKKLRRIVSRLRGEELLY